MSPFWILLQLRMIELTRMIEVVVTTGAIWHAKLQPNCHHQQTNNQLFTGRMPFLSPNKQCQSNKERKSHTPRTCSPQAQDFPSFSWPLNAPGYLGESCLVLLSALWCQYPTSSTVCVHQNFWKWPSVTSENHCLHTILFIHITSPIYHLNI